MTVIQKGELTNSLTFLCVFLWIAAIPIIHHYPLSTQLSPHPPLILHPPTHPGNIIEAMRPLHDLPVWVVVRLCTDDDRIGTYWNDVDKQV